MKITLQTILFTENTIWIPSCGCAELRAKADRNAEARRKAKELGYK